MGCALLVMALGDALLGNLQFLVILQGQRAAAVERQCLGRGEGRKKQQEGQCEGM